MAANLQRLGLAKRFLPSLTLRRGVHASVYDKNIEEHVHSTVVPDYLILPQSDKYWAPHPQTGVFGPTTDHKPVDFYTSSTRASGNSVLEQKAFFRPLEDLEKPPHP
ncbi:late embryogenesis abundant protein At5g17165-like [Olea europaea var. sylvestris]|uniref:late embryogenesis abundant protein At5g17165-like n=1 Tax=Olea europaea var. sylvestris TaxID=158386 RepID=UPI000C1D22BD|nr:late embryogenesis abundant protein At5g17165-like [Olea europaea var. sylvestris]